MMTRRERLMATIQGKVVDRPAVSLYELGGFRIDPNDPDPYNVYNSPDWRPLLELTENHTDLIRSMSAVRPCSHIPEGASAASRWREFFQETTKDDGQARITRTTLNAGGRTMIQETARERHLNTVWTTEHLLESVEDVEAYLTIPDDVFAETINVSPLIAEEDALGDRGIVMVDTEDPLCAAASLFSMENYTMLAFTEPELFCRLLDKMARRILPRTEEVSLRFPGHLWRIYGPEYASEPYLSPDLFKEYVVRYVEPMARAIQRHGGTVRIHSHGRLRNILPLIAEMGVDALDPIEPPPQGDVELQEVRASFGKEWVLFGNLEIADIENMPSPQFTEKVKRALNEGCAGEGRGFVLMPSASPYGREISALCLSGLSHFFSLSFMSIRPSV
ncbi:MAG: uroporphyrinogen decarboxylase family protein, partial [bacterium]